MDTKKHAGLAVIVYFGSLLLYSIITFLSDINFLDGFYFLVVLCCFIKYYFIFYKTRK